jgi:hypothetical protein
MNDRRSKMLKTETTFEPRDSIEKIRLEAAQRFRGDWRGVEEFLAALSIPHARQ